MGLSRHESRDFAAGVVARPIAIAMLTLAVAVIGWLAGQSLRVDLLPRISYAEIVVRVVRADVPAEVMEDEVTRQLEEQLAITEGVIAVWSRTRRGSSQVTLSVDPDGDIDAVLQAASTRLDRAKRFLPDDIDPPVIFKRDPSQLPVMTLVVSAPLRSPQDLGTYVEYELAEWFVNLPGVAAVEPGGGLEREVLVVPDPARLAGHGLTLDDLREAIVAGNRDEALGTLRARGATFGGRTAGRVEDVAALAALPVDMTGERALARADTGMAAHLRVDDVASVIDDAGQETLRIRLDGEPGLQLSVQKQPTANTVEVVDAVRRQLDWLNEQGVLPDDITITPVGDEALFVRQSIHHATAAALTGSGLAMLVVLLFLGDLRRTLLVGVTLAVAVLVVLMLMGALDVTLNIMSLGGLALGVGLLVDNTIVVLENLERHQRQRPDAPRLAQAATGLREVSGAVIASTSTSLAAVLPFLFIGGLVGLLFSDLVLTISTALVASLIVALTLVPAMAARLPAGRSTLLRHFSEALLRPAQWLLTKGLRGALAVPWLVVLVFGGLLAASVPTLLEGEETFLPAVDDGRVSFRLELDRGSTLDDSDAVAQAVEAMLAADPAVATVHTLSGGFVFGRSQYVSPQRATVVALLVPPAMRDVTSAEFAARTRRAIASLDVPGLRVRARSGRVRGLSLGGGEEEVSFRIRGDDLDLLTTLGERAVEKLTPLASLANPSHSADGRDTELSIEVDRDRAAALDLSVADIAAAARRALRGEVITDLLDRDQRIDVRLRLAQAQLASPDDLASVVLELANGDSATDARIVRLEEVARVGTRSATPTILRDRQQRVVNVEAAPAEGVALGTAIAEARTALEQLELPRGFTLYDAGASDSLHSAQSLAHSLSALAVFLVLVVMAVQYENLRNPLIIIASVPFALVGVAIAVHVRELPLSMPFWLGVIMLIGIVVNNAIVLLTYIELERAGDRPLHEAIITAARLRLRPIVMTTLTTVLGMMPLALSSGEGSELLQPLAVVIVFGLAFSLLVSLLLVPSVYALVARRGSGMGDTVNA